jgi:SAM-dependent methyltransferase
MSMTKGYDRDRTSLAVLRWLNSPERRAIWMAYAERSIDHKLVVRWRKQFGEERSAALATQCQLSQAAIEKLGDDGRQWLLTLVGLQQCSDQWTARYVANQIPTTGPVLDVCCGVGADLAALAATRDAVGVDCDPSMAWRAAVNASTAAKRSIATVAADGLSMTKGWPGWVHVDPDRREGTKRFLNVQQLSPPLDAIVDASVDAAGLCIKVAPGSNEDPESDGLQRFHREWISTRRECRQQVLWRGEGFDPLTRTATSIDRDHRTAHFTAAVKVNGASVDELDDWIVDFDVAIRAAGLSMSMGEAVSASAIESPAGYFTSNEDVSRPLCTARRVVHVLRISALERQWNQPLSGKAWRAVALKRRGLAREGITPKRWQSWERARQRQPEDGEPLVLYVVGLRDGPRIVLARP